MPWKETQVMEERFEVHCRVSRGRVEHERAVPGEGSSRSAGRPLGAYHDFTKGLDCEEQRDIAYFQVGAETICGHLAQILFEALEACVGEVSIALELVFRQVATGIFDDPPARNLHLKQSLQAENHIEKVD